MSKRTLSQEDMEKIQALIDESQYQSNALKEILLAIKGDPDLGIEGMVAAQKRIEIAAIQTEERVEKGIRAFETAIDQKITDIEKTVNEINTWKNAITVYIGIITSKKIWRFLLISSAIVVIIFLSIKYGFLAVWQYIKNIVL